MSNVNLIGITYPQYLPTDAADIYFNNRLNSDIWNQANTQDKNSALIESTRAIDNLNFIGVKFSSTQLLEFPRWQPDALVSSGFLSCWTNNFYDQVSSSVTTPIVVPNIPPSILIACCENAICLMDGFDFEIELSSLNVSTSQYATIRDTYDRNLAVTHLRSGIASAKAWIFLKPWLADVNSFTLSRVN